VTIALREVNLGDTIVERLAKEVYDQMRAQQSLEEPSRAAQTNLDITLT